MARRTSGLGFCVILCAVVAGGCGRLFATPSPTPLSDPKEIITLSLSGLQDVQTLHVEAKLDGSINVGKLSGLPGGFLIGLIGNLKLDNSSLSGDVDIANEAAHLSASVPTLFGLTADVVVVDGYVYAKWSLGGNKYSKTPISDVLPGASLAPSASLPIAQAVGTMKTAMDQNGVTATLVGRDQEDGRDAYHVTVSIPMDKLNQGISSVAGRFLGGATIDSASIDYWAYVDSLHPAKLDVTASSASLGSLHLTATLTKYNQPVTITAPPADQVQTS